MRNTILHCARSVIAPLLFAATATMAATGMANAAPEDDPIQAHPAVKLPLAPQAIFTDLEAAGDYVVAVGERGIILRSSDGKTWEQADVPISTMLNRVTFLDAKTGWAGGHDSAILKTTDGGQSWALQYRDPSREQAIYDLHFSDAQNGIAVGAYDLLMRTTDGGKNWSRIDSPVGQGELHHYSITELADGTLLISGERSMLARSTDGGQTWARVASPYFGSYFGAVAYGDTGAIVFGLRGNTYRLENIAALPTVEADEYGEFALGEIPAGQSTLLPVKKTDSLFNAVTVGDRALLVGVNGALLQYKPGQNGLRTLESKQASMIGDIQPLGGQLIVAGESGVSAIPMPR